MRLKYVNIKNFRSIKDLTIDFDPQCRILVGINESGKSNILRALALLKKDHTPQKNKDVRETLPDEESIYSSYVHFIFDLSKEENEIRYKNFTSKILSKKDMLVSYNGKKQSIKKFFNSIEYSIEVNILKASRQSIPFDKNSIDMLKLLGEWKKLTSLCPSDFQIEYEGQNYNLANYEFIHNDILAFTNIPEEYVEKADDNNLKKMVLEDNDITQILEDQLPNVLFWQYKEENLLPEAIDIDTFMENSDHCEPLKNMFNLAGIEDITDSLQEIRQKSLNKIHNYFDRIAKQTTNHFRKVWKDYKNIEFSLKLNANQIVPGIKEQNTYDFASRSDGFKRFITFLLMISVRVHSNQLKNTLILVDEADMNLHPSGARYLRDELIKISNKNYVVYSTHSIFMIDSKNIDRHYIVKKEKEVTTIEQAKESNIKNEELLYNALGFSVLEFLKEKNIIFEGWRDKYLFNTYIKQAPPDLKKKYQNIGVCHADGAKGFKHITPLLELGKRKCLIVSDNDDVAKQFKREYEKDKNFGDWKTYHDIDSTIKAKTGEDFIKTDFLLKKVNDFLPKNMNFDKMSEKLGKLHQIKQWLHKNNIPEEEQKDIINKLKEDLFNKTLRKKHIDIEEYEKLLNGILSYF